jgi:hypothetical protein
MTAGVRRGRTIPPMEARFSEDIPSRGERQSEADPAEGVAAVGGSQDMAVSWGGRGASLAR